MPLFLIGLGLGGVTTFALSETSKKLATAALIGGGLYWYLKKAK